MEGSSSGAIERTGGAGLQVHSPEEWWKYFGSQVRMLRSSLLSRSHDRKLESELTKLLNDTLEVYTLLLGASSKESAPCVMSGQKSSSLEAAFIWLGGWRPTSAIVLVFSIMGIESQRKNVDVLDFEASTPQLTERQLYSLNSLQAHTVQAERDLSNQLGLSQMLVADQNVIAAISSRNWAKTRVAVEEKVSKLRDLLIQADSLRSQTLHELFSVLDPVQAAKCSIAAFEVAFVIKTFTGSLSGASPSRSKPDFSNGNGCWNISFEKKPSLEEGTSSRNPEVAELGSSMDESLRRLFLEGATNSGDVGGDCSCLQTPEERSEGV